MWKAWLIASDDKQVLRPLWLALGAFFTLALVVHFGLGMFRGISDGLIRKDIAVPFGGTRRHATGHAAVLWGLYYVAAGLGAWSIIGYAVYKTLAN
jgi:hypothetical protein